MAKGPVSSSELEAFDGLWDFWVCNLKKSLLLSAEIWDKWESMRTCLFFRAIAFNLENNVYLCGRNH